MRRSAPLIQLHRCAIGFDTREKVSRNTPAADVVISLPLVLRAAGAGYL